MRSNTNKKKIIFSILALVITFAVIAGAAALIENRKKNKTEDTTQTAQEE